MQSGKHHTAALLVGILGLVLLSFLTAPVAGQSTLAVESGPEPGGFG
jgi:hypothetical protein